MTGLISKHTLALVLITAAAAQVCPTTKGWRGIVPLKSTRGDVERLLGHPSDESLPAYLPDKSVVIQYSQRVCDDGWNVPPNTVIAIGVHPQTTVRITDLNLDLTKYKKVPGDFDVPDHFYYKDEKRGFAVSVRNGIVERYIYEPTSEDKPLRCPEDPS